MHIEVVPLIRREGGSEQGNEGWRQGTSRPLCIGPLVTKAKHVHFHELSKQRTMAAPGQWLASRKVIRMPSTSMGRPIGTWRIREPRRWSSAWRSLAVTGVQYIAPRQKERLRPCATIAQAQTENSKLSTIKTANSAECLKVLKVVAMG